MTIINGYHKLQKKNNFGNVYHDSEFIIVIVQFLFQIYHIQIIIYYATFLLKTYILIIDTFKFSILK